MKKIASLVVCLGLLTSALAEEVQSLSASAPQGDGSKPLLVLSLGGGAGFYGGDYGRLYDSGLLGYGVNLGAMYRIAEIPLYAGLDFAIGSWSFSGTPTVDRSASAIQVLPTIVYDISFKGLPTKLVPYVGLSAGPNFYVFRERTVQGQTLKVESRVNVYLEVLIRAGVNYRILENLALGGEIKAGILNYSAVVLPVANLVVSL